MVRLANRIRKVPTVKRRLAQISARKLPRQARAKGLVDAVLDAAIQVLAIEGAHRFTTARVAEKAGVSIGSLYQYFPNKAAILFRLQSDEWQRTTDLLRAILEDRTTPPFDRLRSLVSAFIRSECEEADVRTALHDAAPLYRDAPETRTAMAAGASIMREFIQEVLPETSAGRRALVIDLIQSTLRRVGKAYSESQRSAAEIEEYANAMADMFCAYLAALRLDHGGGRTQRFRRSR